MADYRALRPYLNAIRFDGDNLTEIAEFLGIDWPEEYEPADQIVIELPDGDYPVDVGDYITRSGPAGRYWPCPGRVFEGFYEEVGALDKIAPPDTDDAMDWAKSFESHYPHSGLDAGLMVGWFANYWAACKAVAE